MQKKKFYLNFNILKLKCKFQREHYNIWKRIQINM